jgi:putative membrane protein
MQVNWPSLVFMFLVGVLVLYRRPDLLRLPFAHVSMAYMALLLAYHLGVHRMHHLLARGEAKWSVMRSRIWAHLATVLLFTFVVLLLFREQMTWVWGSAGLMVLGGMLLFLVERARRRPVPPA